MEMAAPRRYSPRREAAMTRETVRTFKRAVRKAMQAREDGPQRVLGQDCALALLARSIAFGHGRLAILRLWTAVQAGACVPREHWLYCSRVAATEKDDKVGELYRRAVARAAPQA
jgi:hypothetical protein